VKEKEREKKKKKKGRELVHILRLKNSDNVTGLRGPEEDFVEAQNLQLSLQKAFAMEPTFLSSLFPSN